MRKIFWPAAMLVISFSSNLASAAEQLKANTQVAGCEFERVDWTTEAGMYFRGNADYRLDYRTSDARPEKRVVILFKSPSPDYSPCKDYHIASYIRLPDEFRDSLFVFDCHNLRGVRYPRNVIYFGMLSEYEESGLYRPVAAWKITTRKEDRFSFKRIEGEGLKDIVCVVLPGNIDP